MAAWQASQARDALAGLLASSSCMHAPVAPQVAAGGAEAHSGCMQHARWISLGLFRPLHAEVCSA